MGLEAAAWGTACDRSRAARRGRGSLGVIDLEFVLGLGFAAVSAKLPEAWGIFNPQRQRYELETKGLFLFHPIPPRVRKK